MANPTMSADELAKAEDHEIINYCGADAMRWTEALYAKFPDLGERLDFDTMLTWFANGMEAACDIRSRQAEQAAYERAARFAEKAGYGAWLAVEIRALAQEPEEVG